ncbi:MAG: hypothetical protein GXW99_05495 [Clostridiales bacterium]|nr:hypothetical protein [Clostridiales bacterium]
MAYYYNGNNGFEPDHHENKSNSYNKTNKDKNDVGSWILIGILFLTGVWPVGLILLIAKLSDGSSRKKSASCSYGRSAYTDPADNANNDWNGAATQAKAAAEKTRATVRSNLTKTPQYSSRGAGGMKMAGILMLCLGIAVAVGAFEYVFGTWAMISRLVYGVCLALGGTGLWIGSRSMVLRQRRFAKYAAVMGEDLSMPITRLAGTVDVPESKVAKDLEIMVEKGLWGQEAYVDVGAGMFFRTRQAAAAYYQKKNPPQPQKKEETAADTGYSGVLRNIRRANDRIADPALSGKIDRLEEVAGKIFRIIESEPAKRDKASTFLNYYLPTTQKLLDSYAEFEEAGVSGDNLNQAKEKIQKTMDAIVAGFEQQLDQLYQVDAMDVESDIRVMETMLKRDGASAEKDFGLGGAATQQEDS